MQIMQGLKEQLADWTKQAEVAERMVAHGYATATRDRIGDIENLMNSCLQEPLSLKDAAQESGYSTDHLGRLIRDGSIPNAGRPGAPRLARRDLPLKPARVARERLADNVQNVQIVQSIIDEGVG